MDVWKGFEASSGRSPSFCSCCKVVFRVSLLSAAGKERSGTSGGPAALASSWPWRPRDQHRKRNHTPCLGTIYDRCEPKATFYPLSTSRMCSEESSHGARFKPWHSLHCSRHCSRCRTLPPRPAAPAATPRGAWRRKPLASLRPAESPASAGRASGSETYITGSVYLMYITYVSYIAYISYISLYIS